MKMNRLAIKCYFNLFFWRRQTSFFQPTWANIPLAKMKVSLLIPAFNVDRDQRTHTHRAILIGQFFVYFFFSSHEIFFAFSFSLILTVWHLSFRISYSNQSMNEHIKYTHEQSVSISSIRNSATIEDTRTIGILFLLHSCLLKAKQKQNAQPTTQWRIFCFTLCNKLYNVCPYVCMYVCVFLLYACTYFRAVDSE